MKTLTKNILLLNQLKVDIFTQNYTSDTNKLKSVIKKIRNGFISIFSTQHPYVKDFDSINCFNIQPLGKFEGITKAILFSDTLKEQEERRKEKLWKEAQQQILALIDKIIDLSEHENRNKPQNSINTITMNNIKDTDEKLLLSWIHLSDIHWGEGDKSDSHDKQYVLTQLNDDIQKNIKNNGLEKPNVIFITGDIAFSGNAKSKNEYEKAKKWLVDLAETIELPPQKIYLVPGNHDVQRASNDNPELMEVLNAVRNEKKLDNELDDKNKMRLLVNRIKPYQKFSKQFAVIQSDLIDKKTLCWVDYLPLPSNLKLRLVGLNTALLAQDKEDKGKLQLGKEQISRTLLPLPKENEIVMVLTHHPFNWLKDGNEALSRIKNNAHIHLCGHIHDAEAEQRRSGNGQDFITVVAGAAHQTEEAKYGYSFGSISIKTNGQVVLRIWPKTWSVKNQRFQLDTDTVPKGKDHSELDLRFKTLVNFQ